MVHNLKGWDFHHLDPCSFTKVNKIFVSPIKVDFPVLFQTSLVKYCFQKKRDFAHVSAFVSGHDLSQDPGIEPHIGLPAH